MTSYEKHVYADPELPLIFHLDVLPQDMDFSTIHWHENIELLYFIEGSAKITLNSRHVFAQKGEIVVVNPEYLHRVENNGENVRYYCLIVDQSLYEQLGFLPHNDLFQSVICDQGVGMYFDLLVKEMTAQQPNYQIAAKQLIALLFIQLLRRYRVDEGGKTSSDSGIKKVELVKAAIEHIRRHYKSELSIGDICSHIGFSKCYFCHVFKEVTGTTVVDYINFLRCTHAQKLLQSGQNNVCEAAELSGFNTLSYFSKTYKKIIGKLPSQE